MKKLIAEFLASYVAKDMFCVPHEWWIYVIYEKHNSLSKRFITFIINKAI